MVMVRVRCRQSRLIADDSYTAGEEYVMDAERAEKYAAREDFVILGSVDESAPAPAIKMRKAPENKMRARERPGWKTESGKTMLLDGIPVEETDGGVDDE